MFGYCFMCASQLSRLGRGWAEKIPSRTRNQGVQGKEPWLPSCAVDPRQDGVVVLPDVPERGGKDLHLAVGPRGVNHGMLVEPEVASQQLGPRLVKEAIAVLGVGAAEVAAPFQPVSTQKERLHGFSRAFATR